MLLALPVPPFATISRVGKLVQVSFGPNRSIAAAAIRGCLLESSRAIGCPSGERNFHIFHQLAVGASIDRKKALQLGVRTIGISSVLSNECHASLLVTSTSLFCCHEQSPDDYTCLGQRGGTGNDWSDSAGFHTTLAAMDAVHLSPDDQANIWSIIAAIMHLGNLLFEGLRFCVS
jgi:myosin heavy subunit